MERGGGNFVTNILVKLLADNSEFMDRMRAAQHATYDSVRAIKALNVTAGGDLNKLLNSTLRNTISFATRAFSAVASDALDAIAFEENNQMALAALAEYRMKQEAITKLATNRVQVGTKILTVEEQLAALEKRRMAQVDQGSTATLDQINWLNDIKRLQIDIQQYENGIAKAREKLGDTTKKLTDTERERLGLQIQDYQQKINDITTYQIPKAQEKLAKSGYQPFQPNENQVDWEAMAAQIMAGGDKVVGIFADQMQGLTAKNIEDIKKKADEESRATMEVLSTMAIKSPFSRKEIVEGYGTLIRMGGISFEQGKEMMQQIVDIQSVTGKGQKGIQAMTLGIGKILAIGRINGDTMNQLVKTAGIPVWEILAKSTGKTVAELQKMMRANKLSADIVMPALQGYMKDFAGKAAEEAGTFVGLVNSIQDVKDSVLVDFFQPIGEAFKRPFADAIDMLTGGQLRNAIKEAGKFFGETIARGIDFIYRSVEKFKSLGEIDGNPFTRLMIIIADAAKEFNVDTTPIISFLQTAEKIFNWALINKDALIVAGTAIKNFFVTLVGITSVSTVLGKIQMFITGFLASPIGMLALAIAGLYFAWQYNFGGIKDWTDKNGPAIVAGLKDIYLLIYDIARILPHVDFDKFLGNLYSLKVVGIDVYTGLTLITRGFESIKNSIAGIMSGDMSPLEAVKNIKSSFVDIFNGIFKNLLNPKGIGNIANTFFKNLASIFDPTTSPVAGALYTILFGIGEFLKQALGWVVDAILNIFKTANLERIWDAVVGLLITVIAGIYGLIEGIFNAEQVPGGQNPIAFFLFRIVGGAIGAALNLIVMAIYDLFVGIIGAIKYYIENPMKAAPPLTQAEAESFLKQAFLDPFLQTFSGGRAEEIVAFVWEWARYILYKINVVLTGIDLLTPIAEWIKQAILDVVNALLDFQITIYKAFGEISTQAEEDDLRARLQERYSKPIGEAFDAAISNVKKVTEEKRALLLKQLGLESGNAPTLPAPNTAFGINPATGQKKPEVSIPVETSFEPKGLMENLKDFLGKTRSAAIAALDDPSLAKEKEYEVVWTTVPRMNPQPLKLSAYEEYLLGGAFIPYEVEIPVDVKPVLPPTGADLSGNPLTMNSGDKILSLLNASGIGPDVSLAVGQQIVSGVTEGVTQAQTQLFANRSAEQAPGYEEIGIAQGNAISSGVVVGLQPGIQAFTEFSGRIIAISNESLPTLKKNLDDWRLDMTSRIGPEISGMRVSVIDPLVKSFDAVADSVQRLSDKIGVLSEKLLGIKIPDQLQAHSPTPFELGLRGIAKATSTLNRQRVPGIFTTNAGVPSVDERQRTISGGSEFGKSTNINLVVKVGDKEVAGVVASSVAGEIKKMIYRDSLRG